MPVSSFLLHMLYISPSISFYFYHFCSPTAFFWSLIWSHPRHSEVVSSFYCNFINARGFLSLIIRGSFLTIDLRTRRIWDGCWMRCLYGDYRWIIEVGSLRLWLGNDEVALIHCKYLYLGDLIVNRSHTSLIFIRYNYNVLINYSNNTHNFWEEIDKWWMYGSFRSAVINISNFSSL